MIQQSSAILDYPPIAMEEAPPTIWGMTPTHLHDRYWACRGVQVVRQGERSEIVAGADVFLLTDPGVLTLFGLARFVQTMFWDKASLTCLRLHDRRDHGYREHIVSNDDGQLVRFHRHYRSGEAVVTRVILTRSHALATHWQHSASVRDGWRTLKSETRRDERNMDSAPASMYERNDHEDVMEFMRRLVQEWKTPTTTIHRNLRNFSSVWADRDATISSSVKFIGPVWIGAGRKLPENGTVLGPAILWDDPAARPQMETLRWDEIQPAGQIARPIRPRDRSSFSRASKRGFDFVLALIGLILTFPIYPFVMLAILLEDGPPFFFAHRRETCDGREFGCLKFRSMRKDAEQIKKTMMKTNQSDGPHFFMKSDPRLTRVGRFVRKTNIDELPQLINVLLGHMSLVGPRPSPYGENQFCPAWREARLSMRPGITGLWQVKRTREGGLDFQEWIKYDIEYVENAGWPLDLKILWWTMGVLIKREKSK